MINTDVPRKMDSIFKKQDQVILIIKLGRTK